MQQAKWICGRKHRLLKGPPTHLIGSCSSIYLGNAVGSQQFWMRLGPLNKLQWNYIILIRYMGKRPTRMLARSSGTPVLLSEGPDSLLPRYFPKHAICDSSGDFISRGHFSFRYQQFSSQYYKKDSCKLAACSTSWAAWVWGQVRRGQLPTAQPRNFYDRGKKMKCPWWGDPSNQEKQSQPPMLYLHSTFCLVENYGLKSGIKGGNSTMLWSRSASSERLPKGLSLLLEPDTHSVLGEGELWKDFPPH